MYSCIPFDPNTIVVAIIMCNDSMHIWTKPHWHPLRIAHGQITEPPLRGRSVTTVKARDVDQICLEILGAPNDTTT